MDRTGPIVSVRFDSVTNRSVPVGIGPVQTEVVHTCESYRVLYDIVCFSSPHVFSHKALQTVTAVQSQWKSILKKYATAVERLNYSGKDVWRYL